MKFISQELLDANSRVSQEPEDLATVRIRLLLVFNDL